MRIPRSLGAYGMAAVLTLFGGGFVRACSTTSAVTSTNDVMKVANSCTTLVNKERAARGIKAVAIDGRVQTAAQKHSTYQASKRTMTHRGATTATYDGGARLKVEKYPWTTWGENVAAGQTTCAQVMSAWMGSAGHKANILNPKFVHIGVAAAKGSNGVIYWTMDLSRG
jgi:uncharacterized protein YkwD